MEAPPKPETAAEAQKRESQALRGTIAATLSGGEEPFAEADKLLLKFHGIYQQDDRDLRRERRAQAQAGKDHSFMARVAIPGGVLSAEQYLVLDRLAETHANGTLRLTTRQGIQFHGVLKGDLKATIAGIHHTLLTTLAACGDVRRNVMACPAPFASPVHAAVQEAARAIAADLAPRSRAYHEIWLDGEQVDLPGPEEEPFYGAQYLPRKFKIAVGLEGDNCVDVYNHDCALLGITNGNDLLGYNLLAGGGLGMTHGKPDTIARLGSEIGFVAPEHAVEAVRTVAAIFRDHGNRADRRHARLKYLLEAWGLERFRQEFRSRASFFLAEPAPHGRAREHDHLGFHAHGDGRFFYGLFVENGRIADQAEKRLKTALARILTELRPEVRLTPMQSVLLAGLSLDGVEVVRSLLAEHGVPEVGALSNARRYAMACPALPTCGLALADAERALPPAVDELEREFARLGLAGVPLTVRMTGCPNGCARPYNADIAFVGRKPGVYHVFVGGGLEGDRLADLFAADVPATEFVATLRPLLERFRDERRGRESLSDFYQRLQGERPRRIILTGKETPSAPAFAPLAVA